MKRTVKTKLICLLLTAVLLCTTLCALPGLSASAAGTPTSIGLAEHGIKAYRDGWIYQSGGKGQSVKLADGKLVRVSDCAGLLYAYFSDLGVTGCMGGATSQVTKNCIMSNDISEGIPRIHGLALTSPDYYDPGSGIYGHIGIYIGNNEEVDNSDYGVNMLWEKVVGGRAWNAWHVFDLGMQYPANGWYAFDGKMVHYTNYEYDVSTVIDGYAINKEGYAEMPGGTLHPVDESMLSSEYASASQVAAYLKTKYSGKDSTASLVGMGGGSAGNVDPKYDGRVTGDGVRIRSQATTKSSIVTTLSKNSPVQIVKEVTGENLTSAGMTSDKWISVVTPAGHKGYIWGPYVQRVTSTGALTAPVITAEGGYVTLTTDAEGADIYYTVDCTEPDENSIPYTGPVYLTGFTYKAIAYKDGQKSGISTASVMSDCSVFHDFTSKNWYFNSIDTAVYCGIFQGGGDNTFSPEKDISRAQFVQALANLDGVDLDQYENTSGFTDIRDGRWYTKAVSWAVETGLIQGYSNNTFRPDQPISREQMCVILAKYSGLEPSEDSTPFADDAKISSWARDAVYACRDHGLIHGVGQNRFQPAGKAIRAEACAVLVNYYNLS